MCIYVCSSLQRRSVCLQTALPCKMQQLRWPCYSSSPQGFRRQLYPPPSIATISSKAPQLPKRTGGDRYNLCCYMRCVEDVQTRAEQCTARQLARCSAKGASKLILLLLQGKFVWWRCRPQARDHHQQGGVRLPGHRWCQVWYWILEAWQRHYPSGPAARPVGNFVTRGMTGYIQTLKALCTVLHWVQ